MNESSWLGRSAKGAQDVRRRSRKFASMSEPGTPNPYKEIEARFAAADRAELTRAEWEWLSASITEDARLWSENSRLRAELERVKRIGRRLWFSTRRVRRQMWRELQLSPRP